MSGFFKWITFLLSQKSKWEEREEKREKEDEDHYDFFKYSPGGAKRFFGIRRVQRWMGKGGK